MTNEKATYPLEGMMYEAEGDKIYVTQDGKQELFLTVHETDTGETKTVTEQAEIIAGILNGL